MTKPFTDPNWPPDGLEHPVDHPDAEQWADDSRDRSFGPAVQAAVELAAAARKADMNLGSAELRPWSGEIIPSQEAREAAARGVFGRVDGHDLRKDDERAERRRDDDPPWSPFAWDSPTAGTTRVATGALIFDGVVTYQPSTVDPPTAEDLSPFQRTELALILADMERATEQLRALLRRQS